MTTLLIVVGVFGMMCWAAWHNTPPPANEWVGNLSTMTIGAMNTDPRHVFTFTWSGVSVMDVETGEQMIHEPTEEESASWQYVPVFRSEPTYSGPDDLQVKFKVEGE